MFCVGIRPYSSSRPILNEMINEVFKHESDNSSVVESVALFVYMWVDPKYRGSGLGDTLLGLAYQKINQLGMFIVCF